MTPVQHGDVAELDVVAANIGDDRDPYAAYARARQRRPVVFRAAA
jgi:hypothetical protein